MTGLSILDRNPASVIFDCDGVILQSNILKSDAFGAVLEGHDPAQVAHFVAWHKATGGVSRFHKFEHFFRQTLGLDDWRARTDAACEAFGAVVSEGLRKCPTVPGFEALIGALQARGIPLAVNTGGAQDEIRAVFADRGLARVFDMVLGSPTPKRENMEILKSAGLIRPGSVYLGDSELDHRLAQEFDLAFIYVGHESEWAQGAEVTRATGGQVVQTLDELVGASAG